MAVNVEVTNRQHVIVPVRFVRAVSGGPVANAPDVDHRAWNNPHFTNWPDVQVRGGQVGVMLGKTVRLRVLREYLDSSAPIYVTVKRPGGATEQIEITRPSRGGPLPRSGRFSIKGKRSTPTRGNANIVEARLGAVDGPVLAECEVRVFGRARVIVSPHICMIHTTAGARGRDGTAPRIRIARVLSMAKAIWRQAGVDLIYRRTQRHHIYNAANVDQLVFWGSGAGTIGWMMGQAGLYRANTLNAYFIRYSRQSGTFSPLGLGLHRGNSAGVLPNPGIFIATDGIALAAGGTWTRPSTGRDLDQELANDTAHEIGHFLGLSHFAGVNSPGRDDTYTRCNLMHPNNLLPQPVASGAGANNIRANDAGYGTGGGGQGHRGCMITMKQHNIFASAVTGLTSNDCQVAQARMQIFQSAGRPLPSVTLY